MNTAAVQVSAGAAEWPEPPRDFFGRLDFSSVLAQSCYGSCE